LNIGEIDGSWHRTELLHNVFWLAKAGTALTRFHDQRSGRAPTPNLPPVSVAKYMDRQHSGCYRLLHVRTRGVSQMGRKMINPEGEAFSSPVLYDGQSKGG
jgi:hypothetical protein